MINIVRIRLRRVGARNQPSYRIVVADKESPRDGRFLEIIGHYNPRTEPATIVVKEDRLYHWLGNGAQPSDSLLKIIKTHGAWERWLRFKGGEEMATLLAEAEAAKVEVDPRTRRDDLVARKVSKKAKAKAAQAEAEAAEPVEAEAVEATAATEKTEEA